MPKKLIFNADDYGRTKLVSAGIRSAHLNGVVTSSTVMMNMPGIEIDLQTALRDCPNLGLGVHLNLTGGKPISSIDKVSSLVDEEGIFPSIQGFVAKLLTISLDQVRVEWNAQIQRFIDLTGKFPDHLDSHHHTSYMTSGLFKLMLELADALNCGIRPPLADGSEDKAFTYPDDWGKLENDFIEGLLIGHTPVKPNYFYSSFFDQSATVEYLIKLINNLGEGTSEIMCHPGLPDKELEKTSIYARQREQERRVLEDDRIRACIEEQRIELINFGKM